MQHEVVPRPVPLGERPPTHAVSLSSRPDAATGRVPPARTRRSTSSGWSNGSQRIRGSLRNQESCRRANFRVPTMVSSRACSSLISPSRYAQHLAVAERPGGGQPVAQALIARAAAPHRPARRPTSPRPAWRSARPGPAGRSAGRSARPRAARSGTGGSPAGTGRRSARPPRARGRPGARCRAGSARRRPGRRRPAAHAGAPDPTVGQLALQPGADPRVGAGEVEVVDDRADVQG